MDLTLLKLKRTSGLSLLSSNYHFQLLSRDQNEASSMITDDAKAAEDLVPVEKRNLRKKESPDNKKDELVNLGLLVERCDQVN